MKEAQEAACALLSVSLSPAEQVVMTISCHVGLFGLQPFPADWVSLVASEQQQLVGLPLPSEEGWPGPAVREHSDRMLTLPFTSGPWEGGTVPSQRHQGSHGLLEGLRPADKAGPGEGGSSKGSGVWTHSHIPADIASEEEVRMSVCTWNFDVLIVCPNNGRMLYVYS